MPPPVARSQRRDKFRSCSSRARRATGQVQVVFESGTSRHGTSSGRVRVGHVAPRDKFRPLHGARASQGERARARARRPSGAQCAQRPAQPPRRRRAPHQSRHIDAGESRTNPPGGAREEARARTAGGILREEAHARPPGVHTAHSERMQAAYAPPPRDYSRQFHLPRAEPRGGARTACALGEPARGVRACRPPSARGVRACRHASRIGASGSYEAARFGASGSSEASRFPRATTMPCTRCRRAACGAP